MPLRSGLAAAQRVWFAVYPAVEERRLVNRIDEFEMLTKAAGHPWVRIDSKGESCPQWNASVDEEERADWFKNPDDIDLYAKTEWRDVLTEFFSQRVASTTAPERTVFALTGLMDLYDFLHVSELDRGGHVEGLSRTPSGILSWREGRQHLSLL